VFNDVVDLWRICGLELMKTIFRDRFSECTVFTHTLLLDCIVLYAMNRDFSCEEHRENPPGSTSISDGRNVLGPEGSHTDCRSRIAPPEGNESGHGTCCSLHIVPCGVRAVLHLILY